MALLCCLRRSIVWACTSFLLSRISCRLPLRTSGGVTFPRALCVKGGVIMYRRGVGERPGVVSMSGVSYLDLPAKSSQFSLVRPTTAYGRYHHLRDVARQAFDAPRSLDSRSVTRIGRGKATQERFRRHPALRPSQSCLRLFPPPSIWHPVADGRRGEDIVGPWGCYRCPCRHPSPIARPGEGVG